ncbi:MAG: hypothetical protein R3348_10115 [Xanthomonadales bacterium]|nr:hypothetical protein [Xanthomonadales bacterium]
MASITHEVWIDAPRERVFHLLSSAKAIGTWWDEQTRKVTSEGIVLEHSPGPEHGTVRFLVLETEAPRLVRWRCVSTHPDNVPASEWTNTEIAFYIRKRSDSAEATEKWAEEIPARTVLRLEHTGWKEKARYLPFCSYAWAMVLSNLCNKAMEDDGCHDQSADD